MPEKRAAPTIFYDSSIKETPYRVIVDAALCGDFLRLQGASEYQIDQSTILVKGTGQVGGITYPAQKTSCVYTATFADSFAGVRARETRISRSLCHELKHLGDSLRDPLTMSSSWEELNNNYQRVGHSATLAYAAINFLASESISDSMLYAIATIVGMSAISDLPYWLDSHERKARKVANYFTDNLNWRFATVSKRPLQSPQ